MIESLIVFITGWVIEVIKFLGYPGIFLLMAVESANIPVPSEVIMPFSGFLVFAGNFKMFWVIFWGALGNLFGSLVSYYLASFLVANREKSKIIKFFISESLLKKSESWFGKYGSASVFFSRLLPVVRTFISLPAGIGKMNIWRFSVLTFFGSLIWSALLAYLGYFMGQNWHILGNYFRKFDYIILGLIIISFVYWAFNHFSKNRLKAE